MFQNEKRAQEVKTAIEAHDLELLKNIAAGKPIHVMGAKLVKIFAAAGATGYPGNNSALEMSFRGATINIPYTFSNKEVKNDEKLQTFAAALIPHLEQK